MDSIYNTANISLSPWVNYTFRVIAYNKIGESDPSFPTPTVCSTKDAVPDTNPQNLRTIGDRKGELHIEWTVSRLFGEVSLWGLGGGGQSATVLFCRSLVGEVVVSQHAVLPSWVGEDVVSQHAVFGSRVVRLGRLHIE